MNGLDLDALSHLDVPDFIVRHTTMRQLQIFEAVVRLGSHTRAAEELFLTQPTVSMQTKKLTDAIGMQLLEPNGRKIEATAAGHVVYRSIREIFSSLRDLEVALSDLKGLKRGKLSLGVVTTAKYLAPELLGRFSEAHPGIELSLKVSNRDRIHERLSDNVDDLYIMGQAAEEIPGLKLLPFAPNPLVVIAPKNHELFQSSGPVSLSKLANYPWIMREPGSGIRDATLKTFDSQGLRPNIRMELGSNEAIKHAVIANLGLSVLSLHSMTIEGPAGPLGIVNAEQFPIMRQWNIVYPVDRRLSLVASAFLDFAIGEKETIRQEMVERWPDVFNN